MNPHQRPHQDSHGDYTDRKPRSYGQPYAKMYLSRNAFEATASLITVRLNLGVDIRASLCYNDLGLRRLQNYGM